ncbi:MAG: GldG family protein [Elusimicrobiota bacterium]|jgi:gliding-associated putative ABC transporter substrate-binding component GldG
MAITLQQRRKRLAVASAAGLGLLALTLLLLNVLSHWLYVRLDLTRSRAYSLSSSSKRLVRQLEDTVVVKAYFSPELPSPYNTYGRYVRDILSEYRSASKGKVQFSFVPPVPAQIFEQQAQSASLLPLQFQEMGANQVQIRRGYMGLVLFYRDKSEVLPVVKDVESLEYELTSRLAKMTSRNKRIIAVTSGHGESDWKDKSAIARNLGDLYEFRDFPLPAASTVPYQADAILVVGPRQKFDEKSLWILDQAIMKGIPAAFMVDTKSVTLGQFRAFDQDSGLTDFLQHYGAKLGDRLVYDAQCQTIGVTQNLGGLSFTSSLPYPFFPLVSRFDEKKPLLRGLEAFALPFCVSVLPSGQPGAGRFMAQFTSSPRSWQASPGTFNVAPNNVPRPKADDAQGPFILGALLEGPFTSYFQSKPLPYPGVPLLGTSPKMQLLVIGSSHLLDPDLPGLPGGEAFISNVLAYLTNDESLLGIRAKGAILRPLKPVRPAMREVVKIVAVLGGAFLPVVLGVVRWRRRQSWRKKVEQSLKAAA